MTLIVKRSKTNPGRSGMTDHINATYSEFSLSKSSVAQEQEIARSATDYEPKSPLWALVSLFGTTGTTSKKDFSS